MRRYVLRALRFPNWLWVHGRDLILRGVRKLRFPNWLWVHGRDLILRGVRGVYRLAGRHILFIHTPKCGGTYVNTQYRLYRSPRITPIGHERFDQSRVRGSTVAGLIRDPADWYASFRYFVSPRNDWKPGHPIRVFSEEFSRDVRGMLENMHSTSFLKQLTASGLSADIFDQEMPELFKFMQATGTGFWTWIMMHHFSPVAPDGLWSRDDVLSRAASIAQDVHFIHMEHIDKDVERVLGLVARPGERINQSQRPQHAVDGRVRHLAKEMDGDVAAILGGYE